MKTKVFIEFFRKKSSVFKLFIFKKNKILNIFLIYHHYKNKNLFNSLGI